MMEGKEDQGTVFDRLAARYDRWFDSEPGRAIFDIETEALRGLVQACSGRWLEVGVGTGRFAHALGVGEGIDPSQAVLAFASRRGIRVVLGRAEALPYPDASFHGILMVVTLCFLANPERAFQECARILRRGGCLVAGFVPRDSSWGKRYARNGQEGHPFYSEARFYSTDEVLRIGARVGLFPTSARSCLLCSPDEPIHPSVPSREGILPGAGFVAIRFSKRS